MIQKIAPGLLLALLFSLPAFSQKYAHMNLGNFLDGMPEVKAANEALKTFAAAYQMKGDSLTKAFDAKVAKFEADYNAGILTANQAAQLQSALQKEQSEYASFGDLAEKTVAAKREELLGPILKKVEDAVTQVAKENGYAMIFDTSTGFALYALDSEDISAKVKTKLGF